MNCKICQLKPSTIKSLSSDNQQAVKLFLEAKAIYQNEIEHITEAEKKAFLAAYADDKGLVTMPNGEKIKLDYILEFDQKIADHLELVAPNSAKDWEGYTGEPEPIEVAEKQPPKPNKAQISAIIKGYQIKLKRVTTESGKQTIQKLIKGYEIALKRAK